MTRRYDPIPSEGAGVLCSRSAEKAFWPLAGQASWHSPTGRPGELPARAWNRAGGGVAASLAGWGGLPPSRPWTLSSRVPHGATRPCGVRRAVALLLPEAIALRPGHAQGGGLRICWPTEGEREIHQSGVAMMWGTPASGGDGLAALHSVLANERGGRPRVDGAGEGWAPCPARLRSGFGRRPPRAHFPLYGGSAVLPAGGELTWTASTTGLRTTLPGPLWRWLWPLAAARMEVALRPEGLLVARTRVRQEYAGSLNYTRRSEI